MTMTKLAWGASMAAQAMLLTSLVCSGRTRDYWTAYLALDLLRSALLWNFPLASLTYFYVWSAGLVVLSLIQFVTVLDLARDRNPWLASWIYGATAFTAWVIALSPSSWPPARQAANMVWNTESLLCLAVLLGSHSGGVFLRTYYTIHATLSTASLVSSSPSWAETVGFAQCVAVCVTFSWWSAKINWRKSAQNG